MSEKIKIEIPLEEQMEKFGESINVIRKEAESLNDYFQRIKENATSLDGESKKVLKNIEKKVNFLKEIDKLNEKELKKLKDEVKDTQGLMGLFATREEKIRTRLALAQKELEVLKKQENVDEKLVKQKEREIELAEKQLSVEKKIEKVKSGMLGIVGTLKDLFSNLVEVMDAATGGLFKQQLAMFTFAGQIERAKEHMKEMRDAGEKFAQTTGRVFSMSASGITGPIAAFGLTTPKLIQTSGELYASMSKFSDMAPGFKGRFTEMAARMSNFGISVSTAGKNFDTFTKGLHMSSGQAVAMTDRLQRAAIGAGIAPKKMVEEFATAMPRLAAYGAKAIDVYVNLQKQAKALGMEMQQLTAIVGDQFDTFEGSATAAGKLNAILGGNYLNSVEMLNASEDERIMLLKRSMDEAGVNYASLSKFEQKAIASALGISDMEQANKLFGVSSKEVSQELKKQDASQAQLLAGQSAAASAAEKMKAATEGAAKTVNDLANKIKEFFKPLTTWLENHQKVKAALKEYGFYLGLLAPVILKVGGAIGTAILRRMFSMGSAARETQKIVSENAQKMSEKFNDLSTKVEKMGKSGKNITVINKKMSKTGEIANSAGVKIVAFGVALLLAGLGIKFASEGLAKLVSAFKELNPEQQSSALKALGIVMGGFVAMLLVMALVGGPTLPVLFGIGLAMVGIGFGMKLAFDSMAKFVEALKDISKTGKEVFLGVFDKIENIVKTVIKGLISFIDKIIEVASTATDEQISRIARLAESIGSLALALAGGAIKGAIGSWLGGKSSGQLLIEFNQSLQAIQLEKLQLFNSLVAGMVQILQSSNLATLMSTLTEGIRNITQSLNDMPSERKISLETLNNTLNIIKTISAENTKPTTDAVTLIKDAQPKQEFIKVMEHFHAIHTEAKEKQDSPLLQGIKEVGNILKENFSTDAKTKVQLVISGKDLANALNNYGETSIEAILHSRV